MSTDRTSQRVAVFTRNHPGHLERAARLSTSDPDAPIVFRSRVRWASAQEAVAEQDRVEVYIAPMDGKNEVRYTAKLVRVILDPDPSDAVVQRLLQAEPAANPGEEVWSGSGSPAETLYELRECRPVRPGVPVTELVKRDGTPISPDFGYSYALVQELPAARLG